MGAFIKKDTIESDALVKNFRRYGVLLVFIHEVRESSCHQISNVHGLFRAFRFL